MTASMLVILVNKADKADLLRIEDKLEQKLDRMEQKMDKMEQKMEQKMDQNMQYTFLGFVVLALLMVFKDKLPA